MQHAKKGNEVSPVCQIILSTLARHRLLALGILLSVCGAILTALVPPLVLARIIDTLTLGTLPPLFLVLFYFIMLTLTGLLESAREGLLTVCGQKITHALRSRLMGKFVRLSAEDLNRQEPGAVVSRFVGDVDTVENLFTSGIISMFADACKIISILVVVWFQTKGLALIFLLLLPLLFLFTRHVQKNMLAAQIENRRAVSRASAHVPETLHNIRTIQTLGKERYMEQQYDRYIGDSYRAMERTNFYDAIYLPIILILNAVVVAAVMLLSASGRPPDSDTFRYVCRYRRGCHELYFPDLLPGREPGHGDSDHSVGDGGYPPDTGISGTAGEGTPGNRCFRFSRFY